MSVEEKVGQLLVLGFTGTETGPGLTSLIRETKPGGLLLSPLNVASPESLESLTAAAQEMASRELKAPLLIAANQEGGSVSALSLPFTQFPSPWDVGLACDKQKTRSVARAIGEEMMAVGINMNLAPVLDVGRSNTAIGDRSFGDSASLVAEMGLEFITGLTEVGVIATAKHFPGHGSAEGDSHIVLPADSRDGQTIRSSDLAPYRRVIASGLLDAVMTAHVYYAGLDDSIRPATLSPRVLIDLLRREMGFAGVIISDSMTMGAMTNPNRSISTGAVEAVLAGVDILLIPAYPSYQEEARVALLNAVRDGTITITRLNQSVRRILELKQKYGVGDKTPDGDLLGAAAEHARLTSDLRARAASNPPCHL
jgi:beta-N-acetylhexosaminidase